MKTPYLQPGAIRRFTIQWPELFWISVAWLTELVIAWLRYPINGVPYGLKTVIFYLGCLACVVVPAFIFGARREPPAQPYRFFSGGRLFPDPKFAVFAMITFLTVAVFIYVRREYIGIDVTEMRSLRGTLEVSTPGYRAYMLLAAFALPSVVFWIEAKQHFLLRIGFLFVFAVGYWKASMISGARFELLPILLMSAVALWFRYSDMVLRRPLRAIGITGSLFAFVVALNSGYNLVSTKGGDDSLVAAELRNNGAAVLQLVGIKQAPLGFEHAAGSVVEYVFPACIYLDFYLAENQFPPTRGAHQFEQIMVRAGLNHSLPTKLAVDDLYGAIGIYYNVWSTALREMCIDFGVLGTFVQCIVMGAFLGLAKRSQDRSLAAQNLYLMLSAFFLAAPLVSLFKSKLFEMGIYSGLAWFAFDAIRRRPSIRKAILRAEPTQEPAYVRRPLAPGSVASLRP